VEFKRPITKLLIVLLTAGALKEFYSTAGANDLSWILTPTTFLVELATGEKFTFEANAGYINDTHSFLIAPACAGVNFLITAFLLLTCSRLLKYRTRQTGWAYISLAAVIAYLTTLVANSIRISIALLLRQTARSAIWVTPDQLHRLEGIVIYFGFLVILFVVSESLTSDDRSSSTPSSTLARRYLPPLLAYYATTFGVPLINGAFHGALRTTEFWEYSVFVLIIPAVLLTPVLLFWMFTGPPPSLKARTAENPEIYWN
jgi:exosortase K